MTDGKNAEELLKLLELEPLEESERHEISQVINGIDSIELEKKLQEEVEPTPVEQAAIKTEVTAAAVKDVAQSEEGGEIRNQISKMKLPQKIKLAMFGNATCRNLLIRDTNRMVQQFVLKNPRIQVREIEDFAKNPNLSEQVLRTIGANTNWMKSYAAKWHLVGNPKTPVDISMRWLKFLNITEIKKLAKSKNIPQVIVTAARKKMEDAGPQ